MMKKFKAHSLTGQITDKVMDKAFKAVKRNRGAAGLDKVSIGMYQANLEQNQMALMKKLKDRTYKASPLRRHYIPKGKGKLRPLGIPNVKDRVAQEVIRSRIEPIFEKIFHDNSYGFRKGKNAHQAIERLMGVCRNFCVNGQM
jgi:RNA-directed DNA polymerase